MLVGRGKETTQFQFQPSAFPSWELVELHEATSSVSDFRCQHLVQERNARSFLTSDFRVQCSRPRERVCKRVNFKVQHLSFNFKTEVTITQLKLQRNDDSGSQKLQRSCETPTFSHLSNALTKGFQTINSAPIDRAPPPGARSKSNEFFVWNPIFSTLDLICV